MADHHPGAVRGDGMPADESPGTLSIADRVLEKIAARAALDIAGVVRHRGGVGSVLGPIGEKTSLPHATIHAGGSRITLSVALEWPCAVAEVARRTREHVATEVERLAGIEPLRVDVTVSKLEPRQTIRRLQRGYVDLPPVADDVRTGGPADLAPADNPDAAVSEADVPDTPDPQHDAAAVSPTISTDMEVRR
ncbi:Asp23/Gls24 family envelope stress response protein [Gordonia sp. 'Campus']|uniref:Asp23/Gls24 family envelope stress response protein n=1 Tax=Gordonia sp. 'Campus' TaxID=2915824 RepID=UPI001EE401B8|nr:Asp23/Gls24 family envelope stress response protein [Gordonia sp. 'Campus']